MLGNNLRDNTGTKTDMEGAPLPAASPYEILQAHIRIVVGDETEAPLIPGPVMTRIKELHELIQLLEIANKILDSYKVEDNFTTIIIPPGISESDALKALDRYFQAHYPDLEHPVIDEGDLWKIEGATDRLDVTQGKTISIHATVPNCTRMTEDYLWVALGEQGMKPADPMDIILVAATHACKFNGGSVFGSTAQVRTSQNELGVAYYRRMGIRLVGIDPTLKSVETGASGTLL